VLRHQLEVVHRQKGKPRLRRCDRLHPCRVEPPAPAPALELLSGAARDRARVAPRIYDRLNQKTAPSSLPTMCWRDFRSWCRSSRPITELSSSRRFAGMCSTGASGTSTSSPGALASTAFLPCSFRQSLRPADHRIKRQLFCDARGMMPLVLRKLPGDRGCSHQESLGEEGAISSLDSSAVGTGSLMFLQRFWGASTSEATSSQN
jgi:hypothetical protein